MSSQPLSLEERVAALEQQVSQLLTAQGIASKQKDWRRTIGIVTYDEVMRAIDEHALRFREEDRRRTRDQNAKGGCELS